MISANMFGLRHINGVRLAGIHFVTKKNTVRLFSMYSVTLSGIHGKYWYWIDVSKTMRNKLNGWKNLNLKEIWWHSGNGTDYVRYRYISNSTTLHTLPYRETQTHKQKNKKKHQPKFYSNKITYATWAHAHRTHGRGRWNKQQTQPNTQTPRHATARSATRTYSPACSPREWFSALMIRGFFVRVA